VAPHHRRQHHACDSKRCCFAMARLTPGTPH
jgi:hypothetical protein